MIKLGNVFLARGTFTLEKLNLQVPSGQYAVLQGQSGSGKTTIMEAIAGLVPILAGTIEMDDQDVSKHLLFRRNFGYVPQDVVLFSQMTVRKNLLFSLFINADRPSALTRHCETLIAALGLGSLLNRGVSDLSGGEKQRVALGRALMNRPRFLLMDEPLSAVDPETRALLIQTLQQVRCERQTTVLHVTHSDQEAVELGDLFFRLENGTIRSR